MSDETPEPTYTYSPWEVRCHVGGCENNDLPVTIRMVDGTTHLFICGACGTTITDITEVA